MINECFDQHLDNLIFGSIWLIISLIWNLFTFVIHREHSVVLHCVIGILIPVKIAPGLSLFICYLPSLYTWLTWPAYAFIGIIEVITSVADIGIFYFISIGMGIRDLPQAQIQIKAMILSISLSYLISSLVYTFLLIGTLLSVFYFQLIYSWFLFSTLHTVSEVRDTNSAASSKQIKILDKVSGCVFVYCQLSSGLSCVLVLSLYFDWGIRFLGYWNKGIQACVLIRILYIVRSRLRAGYTHDFLQEPRSVRPGILQASLGFLDYPISYPGCLVINPDYPHNLTFGYLL